MRDDHTGQSASTAERFPKIDRDEVKGRIDLVALIGRDLAIVGGPKASEVKALCPFHADSKPSLRINRAKGLYFCDPCGAKGDCFTWMMQHHNMKFSDALRCLAEEAGVTARGGNALPAPKPVVRTWSAADDARAAENGAERAREVWRAAVFRDIEDTDAESYLNGRGIEPPPGFAWPAALRFDPRCLYLHRDSDGRVAARLYYPALVAGIQNVAGKTVGVDRIYLNTGGAGRLKAVRGHAIDDDKKMLGQCFGNAVRLGPATETLHLAEGLETALSVWASLGMHSESVWAVLSLNNFAAVELPAAVKRVALWTDSDERDRRAARKIIAEAAERFAAQGRAVRLVPAPEGRDWNDVLRGQSL